MILVAYRHGLRASQLCGLRWDQIDLNSGLLHVRRAKGGIDIVHPLSGKEIRALRQLRREKLESRYVFVTERGGPATTAGFLKTIARTGETAKASLRRLSASVGILFSHRKYVVNSNADVNFTAASMPKDTRSEVEETSR